MNDLISRQAAIDALDEEPAVWDEKDEYEQGLNSQWHYDVNAIKAVPSAQPNMLEIGNLIERDKAIETVLDLHADHRVSWKDAVIDTLAAMPSAQPKPQWIPCSERLPHGSCSDLVNVSIHDDSGDTPFDYTSCGWVTTDGEYWIVDNEINNHVVAWMPLPEPWRGEEP